MGIPVALGTLAAYLEKHGIRCNVVDEEITDLTPEVLREKAEGLARPLKVGITCLTAHVARAYSLAKEVKEVFPDATVILGGIHPTSLPDEALSIPEVDYVVRGEGEEVLLHLIKALDQNEDPDEILGLSFRKNGKTVHNPQAPLIPDINTIPDFPYHLFDNPKYDMGFLTTSRGCPFRCSYCSIRTMTGTTYRYLSAERIVAQIELLVNKYKQKAIVFYDDNFCTVPKRVHSLCDMIIEKGLHKKVELSVQTRADNFLIHGGEALAKHMAEAGFKLMAFGMETGEQRLANLIRKDETVETHLEAGELCKKHGMDLTYMMIFGLPTELPEDRETSFQTVKRAGVLSTKYNNLIPYPGTPIFNELKESGRLKIMPHWKNFNSTLAITSSVFDKTPLPYVPETCSEWELKRDIIQYNLRSYINWHSIGGMLGHTKGIGWFMLPEGWWKKPRELWEMSKIFFHVIVNLVVTSLPLWLTTPLMCAIDPKMKDRMRVKNYDANSYKQKDWDHSETRAHAVRLSQAKKELASTGSYKMTLSTESKS